MVYYPRMKKLCISGLFISLLISPISYAATEIAHPQIERIEVGFSPEGDAEAIIIKAIQSAQNNIKIMAYSFTSKPVVKALISAHHQGVNIAIVADSSNIKNKSGSAALSTLVTAGIHVKTVDAYRIMHDKIVLIDDKTIELGSFNYTKSAATVNSENAMVIWNAPEVVKPYLAHWQSRWDQGTDFHTNY